MTHKQNTLCAVDGHLCCLSHFITVISGDTNVIRRSGSNVLQLAVDKSLKAYQEGMDGVDRSDQYRECGSGFASKAHYKVLQEVFFAILDFMVLNAFFALYMS